MKKFSQHLFLLLALTLAFSSCSKKDDAVDAQQTAPNTTPAAPSDADGLIAAVNSIQVRDFPNPANLPNMPTTIDVEINLGVAVFYENNDTEKFLEAGTVTVNSKKDLEKQSNNSYISTFDATSTDGTDLGYSGGSPVTWKVSGGAGASSFTYTTGARMPTNVSLVGDYAETDISSALTVSIDKVSTYADSVLFIISSEGNNIVQFTGAGNATSHTFTAAELSVLTGTGVIQVVPYTIEKANVGGKNIYFVNEVVVTAFTEFK